LISQPIAGKTMPTLHPNSHIEETAELEKFETEFALNQRHTKITLFAVGRATGLFIAKRMRGTINCQPRRQFVRSSIPLEVTIHEQENYFVC
jgi:hypothetical protein